MSLKEQLISRIRQDGPMTVADYMAECLLRPDFGYYATQDPFGADGDFVTAPEITQMFGELIGLALAQAWIDQGAPAPFVLAELGPGRGTLMSDILRATASVAGFHKAARIVLLEASPKLRAKQADALQGYDPTWISTIEELPERPLFLVANEFFDALPIRQFVRDGDTWRERLIGAKDDELSFGLGPTARQAGLDNRLTDTSSGDLVEVCIAAVPIVASVSHRIAANGGAALIVDYGDWRSQGDTFEALQNHQRADPLAEPGQADLTAHVDFEALAGTALAAGCAHSRLTPQGVFLERLGITARAQALAARATGQKLEMHIAAHRRLTHPNEMGNLFKVLGLFPTSAAPPPGLER